MSSLPPGPRSALLATIGFFRDPIAILAKLSERYGDPFTVPTLQGDLVLSGDPEAARAIFGADPDTFRPLAGEEMAPFIGRSSLLLTYGAPHREARKLLMPPFHGERMRHFEQLMADLATRAATSWERGQPLTMVTAMKAISLDVIIRAVMGVSAPERVAAIHDALTELLAKTSPLIMVVPALRHNFGGLGPWAAFRRRKQAADAILQAEIAERRQRPADFAEKADILSMLVAAKHSDGNPMDEQEIIDHLFTLLLAGHDTSATALAWAFYFLHKNPAVLARLQDELAALPSSDGKPQAAALSSCRYLEAVCQEALRLRPLVLINSRRLLRPFVLKGVELPVGVGVGPCSSLIHMRPELYPEPTAFRPERFLERSFTAAEYFPFGGGARRCIGAAFAMHELKIVLGRVLAARRLELIDREVTAVLGLATVGPKGGVRMVPQ